MENISLILSIIASLVSIAAAVVSFRSAKSAKHIQGQMMKTNRGIVFQDTVISGNGRDGVHMGN